MNFTWDHSTATQWPAVPQLNITQTREQKGEQNEIYLKMKYMTSYGLNDRGFGFDSRHREEIFHSIQTGIAAHPASSNEWRGGATEMRSWLLPFFFYCRGKNASCIIMTWRSVKHTDNFSFSVSQCVINVIKIVRVYFFLENRELVLCRSLWRAPLFRAGIFTFNVGAAMAQSVLRLVTGWTNEGSEFELRL
jgi:hypothetical protein